MYCDKLNINVLVRDCESCISERQCKNDCLSGFVWGCNDDAEPIFSNDETESEDVFDNLEIIMNVEKPKTNISNKLRWDIFNRDKFTCQSCGSTYDLTIDHKHPRSKGGCNKIDNLQTLCRRCNCKKSNRTEQ